jgi:N,N'-diacetylchitobiose phosphorylase
MRYGHFDLEAHEYVVDRVDVPASWINYLGTKDMCTVINQVAGGYSFYRSSERGRITRFRPNGVPKDRPGHYLYLRDRADGDFWSASWQPVGKPLDQAEYRARHGLGYSVFECNYRGIAATQKVFIPVDAPVEVWDVTVTNHSDQTRELDLFGYVEFSFHNVLIDNQNFQMSLYAAGADYQDGVIQDDFYYEPWTYHYFTSTLEASGFDCLRDSFIGAWHSESNPIAVVEGQCRNSEGTTANHCGALQHTVTLEPGQSLRLAYLLGYGNRAAGSQIRDRFAAPGAVDQAFAALSDHWQTRREQLTVQTASADMNLLLNDWNLYQAETCVVWSRFASFVEVGGRTGLGYRDTAQDLMAVSHTNPAAVERRLQQLLRGQMSAGYGLHLFDPELFAGVEHPDIPVGVKLPTVVPSSNYEQLHGIEDACSDDHLWLVPSVLAYVKETGNTAFLEQIAPWADGGQDTVYRHLLRAVEFTAAHLGANGLAQGLRADWNDCLNLGGGESVLVTFLHVWAARELADAARYLGRTTEAESLEALAERSQAAANRAAWDGDWYLRGFTATGNPIGSAACPEGKLFLEHTPWAVISGTAPRDRALSCMDAIWEHLRSPYGAHLVWPSYTVVDDAIGYVTRVYPGVKENGAIFSHPNAWPVIAEAMLGRGDRAWDYYQALAPSRYNDQTELRRAEPYAYCQFTFGRDHARYGQAENPWLTGTAGWMYTAATQHILGVRPDWDALVVDPCIPPEWDGFQVTRRWRGAVYQIEVLNPGHVSSGVAKVEVWPEGGLAGEASAETALTETAPAGTAPTQTTPPGGVQLVEPVFDALRGRLVARLPLPGDRINALAGGGVAGGLADDLAGSAAGGVGGVGDGVGGIGEVGGVSDGVGGIGEVGGGVVNSGDVTNGVGGGAAGGIGGVGDGDNTADVVRLNVRITLGRTS